MIRLILPKKLGIVSVQISILGSPDKTSKVFPLTYGTAILNP
jgi:hypothetical protein